MYAPARGEWSSKCVWTSPDSSVWCRPTAKSRSGLVIQVMDRIRLAGVQDESPWRPTAGGQRAADASGLESAAAGLSGGPLAAGVALMPGAASAGPGIR